MRFPVLNFICLTRKAHFSLILTGDGLRMYLFYLEAFIPVLFIFNIKSAFICMIRSVMVCLSSAVLCFVFILNSISAPMVHNYTRYSYTESFQKISLDNRDINEAVEDVDCIYPGLSFPVEENEDIFRPIFLAGKGGENVSITFLDDNGNERSILVQKTGNYEISV